MNLYYLMTSEAVGLSTVLSCPSTPLVRLTTNLRGNLHARSGPLLAEVSPYLARPRSNISNVEEDGWLIGEYLLLNADDGSVHGVVDVGEVSLCGSLSDTSELVVDGTVA